MSDQDVADLYAYLMRQEPVAEASKRHEVGLPFRWRFPAVRLAPAVLQRRAAASGHR